jgi:hypothetical protein
MNERELRRLLQTAPRRYTVLCVRCLKLVRDWEDQADGSPCCVCCFELEAGRGSREG